MAGPLEVTIVVMIIATPQREPIDSAIGKGFLILIEMPVIFFVYKLRPSS